MDTLTGTEPNRALTLTRNALSSTPRRLTLVGTAITALVVAFTVVLADGASASRGALSALSVRTAEMSALNDLYFRLNDMDAQAANALLVGFQPMIQVSGADDAQASDTTYESDRAAVSADLQRIALNPALADQYTKLLTAIGGYEELVAQALYLDENGGPQAPAAPPATALYIYTEASGRMHNDVLPIAQDITARDSADVDGMYSGDRGGIQGMAITVIVFALLLAAALAAGHRYLGRRFRRILTPALAGAVVLVLTVGGLGASLLLNEASRLKTAKADAFDSINALTKARAVSYDANADESRWLLERTPTLQQSFFAKVTQVAAVPDVNADAAAHNPALYYSGLSGAAQALSLDAARNRVSNVRMGGLLGAELNNITFPGEAQAAYTAAKDFEAYLRDDATIRSDVANNDYTDAVKVDVGTTQGLSNYTFNQYDAALQNTIAVNQNAFQGAIDDGLNELSPWSWLPYAAAVLALALTIVALYPRLREYR